MSAADEYRVLKWKTSKDSTVTHEFFVKPHAPLGATDSSTTRKPVGRTLLVLNIPPYLTRINLTDAFKDFGKIKEIILQDHPSSAIPSEQDALFRHPKTIVKGYQVAYVVFRQESTVKEIMDIEFGDIAPIIIKKIRAGLPSWIQQYNSGIVSTDVLEQSVKDFLQKFERDEIQKKLEAEKEEADADGWVTVSRKGKGKRAGAIRTEKMEERLKAKKKRWEKQLVNFTPTQIKETRAKQLEDLKKKFEEDRQRIQLLRQQRKFKPF